MEYKEAIEVIRSNYPPPQYTMLREALEVGIRVLEEKIKEDENACIVDVENFYELEKEHSTNE